MTGLLERVQSSFDRQGAMGLIGATIRSLEPGLCSIGVPYRADLSQQNGYFHAGITSTIADSAGGYAALSAMPSGSEVLSVEFKINLIAPAEGDDLVATARVVRSGRTLTVVQAEVVVMKDARRTVCAIMQQTLIRIDRAQNGAS